MSDLTQSGPTLIFDLINTANPGLPNGPLSASNVTLGTPAANTTNGSGDNSQVEVTGIEGQGYSGTDVFTYNRIDIGAMFTTWGISATLSGGSGFTNASDMLTALNAAYSLDLQASDIVDGPIGASSFPDSYTLTIADGSLVYTGTLAVTLNT